MNLNIFPADDALATRECTFVLDGDMLNKQNANNNKIQSVTMTIFRYHDNHPDRNFAD